MQRRELLRLGARGALLGAFASLAGCGRPDGDAAPETGAVEQSPGPAEAIGGAALQSTPPARWAYGSLSPPDGNGVRLPDGFSSRVVARSGQPVGPTGYVWHAWPDGAAVFPLPDGGWAYVSNSEVPDGLGGVSMLRFGPDGAVTAARSLLTGTSWNCSGGATPWGTWLSCEEQERGRVFEVDPLGTRAPVARPALGRFIHEAAAVRPDRAVVYLTEDSPDGRFYRCRLSTVGSLEAGVLEVAAVDAGGAVSWLVVPDPQADIVPTRSQVPASTAFAGGEGCWYADGAVVFTTKLDGRLWRYDEASSRLSVIYDVATQVQPDLTGVDNLTGWPGGGLVVCEDGGDMQLVGLSPDGSVSPILQVVGQDTSELSGVGFDRSGQRLYVSSQRGVDGNGIIYEVTGPFPYRRALRVS
jgi:sugar lactone lactonase YvrE